MFQPTETAIGDGTIAFYLLLSLVLTPMALALLVVVILVGYAYIKGDLTFGWIRQGFSWLASFFRGKS